MLKSYELLTEDSIVDAISKMSYCRLARVDVSAKPFDELIEEENEKISKYNVFGEFYQYIKKTFHLYEGKAEARHTSPFGMYHFIGRVKDDVDPKDVYAYVNGNMHTHYFYENHKILLSTRHIIEEALHYNEMNKLVKKYGDVELKRLEVIEKREITHYPDSEREVVMYDLINKEVSYRKPKIYLLDVLYDRILNNGTLLYVCEFPSRAMTHQLVRHQSFGYQQQSLRYITMVGSKSKRVFLVPIPESIAYGDVVAYDLYIDMLNESYDLYSALVGTFKIKAEDARSILPMGVSSVIVMGGLMYKPNSITSIEGFNEFFKKRTNKHAQWEIRMFALAMQDIFMNVLSRYEDN